jgi:hypothetical protein
VQKQISCDVLLKTIKFLLSFLLMAMILPILFFNLRIHYSPDVQIESGKEINMDVVAELRGLNSALAENADADMQRLYPEGYIFLNALYALSLTNFIGNLDKQTLYFREGYREIHSSWTKINSEIGRSTFHEIQPGNFGAFYSGWNNYVLAKKLSLQDSTRRDTSEVIQFKNQCKAIALSFEKYVYPVSYVGAAWPADGMVCMTSLALHDRLFQPRYSKLISQWIEKVKNNLDENGLIPHSAHPITGKRIESARGSSHGLMLIFLKDIDAQFGAQQFTTYRALFLDEHVGLCGIREYPNSNTSTSSGDIDSGPVILGIGSAATLVGMHTLSLYGDHETSTSIRNEIETFGFPTTTSKGSKHYLFGKLPIADAFISWGLSEGNISEKYNPAFLKFHFYSLLAGGVLGLMLWWLWKKR